MTVKDFLVSREFRQAKERLIRLKLMQAPTVIITSQEQLIQDLKFGNFKVQGDSSLLDVPYEYSEIKKGNNGKEYIQLNGNINYFPKAKYGRYITTV